MTVGAWRGLTGAIEPEDRERFDRAVGVAETIEERQARIIEAETASTTAASQAALDRQATGQDRGATAGDRAQTEADRTAAEQSRRAAEAAALTLNATPYVTRAVMPASGTADARAYVYSDGAPANNGLWFWTGTAWQKDALDVEARLSQVQSQASAAVSSAATKAEASDVARAAEKIDPIQPAGGTSERPEIAWNVVDELRRILLGFNSLDAKWEFGTPINFGEGRPEIRYDDARFHFSVEDEAGYSFLAVTKDDPPRILVGGAEVTAEAAGGVLPAETGLAAHRAASALSVLDSDEAWQTQSRAANRLSIVGSPFMASKYESAGVNSGFEVGYMPASENYIRLAHTGSYIRSRFGFLGTSNNTLRAVGSSAIVKVFKWGVNVTYEVVQGSVVESNEAEPVHAISILLAGQSQLETGFRGGFIPGFMDGLLNKPVAFGESFLSSEVVIDPYFVNGTLGSSAICKTSVAVGNTRYWWDSDTDGPGPVLLNYCIANIDTAIAAGQPVPETILWAQGESDVPGLVSGATSEARYRAERQKVHDYIRAHLIAAGAVDPQIICIMLGSYERTNNGAGWQAVRRSYLQQFSEVPWVHYGAEMYDMPRPWLNLHMYAVGRYTLGVRMARAYANLRHGQANSLGPQITSATLLDGAQSVRLAFTAGIRLPRTPAGFALRSGAGVDIPVSRIEVAGANVILHADQDVTGAQVIYPADHFPDSRGDGVIYNETLHVKMPGLPLRSTLINIT